MKLLLIEDNSMFALTLKSELESRYVVKVEETAEKGELQAQTNDYDIILLDLSLPDKNGLWVCRALRSNGIKTPILILTGEDSTATKVELLDSGADDYLTKPFKIDELYARIRALLRRQQQSLGSNTLQTRDIILDLDTKTVRRDKRIVPLRRKEYYILEYLVRNAGNVVSRGMILDHVWEDEADSLTNVVDVHIKYLRDRIDKPFPKKIIKTIHGIGYKIEA